jgi:hypothetical protein
MVAAKGQVYYNAELNTPLKGFIVQAQVIYRGKQCWFWKKTKSFKNRLNFKD